MLNAIGGCGTDEVCSCDRGGAFSYEKFAFTVRGFVRYFGVHFDWYFGREQFPDSYQFYVHK